MAACAINVREFRNVKGVSLLCDIINDNALSAEAGTLIEENCRLYSMKEPNEKKHFTSNVLRNLITRQFV